MAITKALHPETLVYVMSVAQTWFEWSIENCRADMTPGKYHLANGVGNLVDTFQIALSTNPNTVIGYLNGEQKKITVGNWDYELVNDSVSQKLYLSISVAENADASYRVWKYNSDGTTEHAATYNDVTVGYNKQLIVLKSGIVDEAQLNEGGTLHVRVSNYLPKYNTPTPEMQTVFRLYLIHLAVPSPCRRPPHSPKKPGGTFFHVLKSLVARNQNSACNGTR